MLKISNGIIDSLVFVNIEIEWKKYIEMYWYKKLLKLGLELYKWMDFGVLIRFK